MIEALIVAAVVWFVAYRFGYRSGHIDGFMERVGHQPVSRHGRRTHRHLTSYEGGRH